MAFKNKAVVALAIALVLMVPVAMAGHFTVVRADRDTGGNTGMWESIAEWQDDGEQMPGSAPGLLSGVNEKVVETGGTAGDGSSLILDSKFIWGTPNSNFGTNYYTRNVFGQEVIPPSLGSFMAWYGWWDDKANPGIIDEYAASPGDLRDEFLWRGAASNEPGINMISWVYPSNPEAGCRPPAAPVNDCRDDILSPRHGIRLEAGLRTLGGLEDPNRRAPDFGYADRTDGGPPGDEAWIAGNGWMTVFIDDSLLRTTWVMTAADAPALAGAPEVYDPAPSSPPAGFLVDVDRYESLSPTIEGLYASAATIVRNEYSTANSAYFIPLAILVVNTLSLLDSTAGPVDDLVFPGYAQDVVVCAGCNVQTSWNWMLQLRLQHVAPLPAVVAPVVGQVGPWGFQTTGASPGTAPQADRTLLPGFVNAQLRTGVWLDDNQDGWIGDGCAGVTGCTDPYRAGIVDDPNDYTESDEFIPDCSPTSTATVHVQPLPGEVWPDHSYVAYSWNRLLAWAYVPGQAALTPLTGTQRADLVIDTAACNTGAAISYTRDALLLANGSSGTQLQAWVVINFPQFTDVPRSITVQPVTLQAQANYL